MFSYAAQTIKSKYKQILAVLGIYFGLSVLTEAPFWFMFGLTPSSAMVRSIFDDAVINLNKGVPILQSIPHDQFGTLMLILCIDLVLSTLVIAFVNGGMIAMFAEERNDFKHNLAVFFKQGWQKLSRLVGVYLLMMGAVIVSILFGVLIGIVVFPIAALAVVIAAFIAVYFVIKLAFLEYEAVLTGKPFMEMVQFSFKISAGYGWPIFLTVIGSGFVSSAIYGLTGNLIILSNLISSVFPILTIILLMPLYLEARRNG